MWAGRKIKRHPGKPGPGLTNVQAYGAGIGRERKISKELRINQQIRCREVRVIDDRGEQLGIMDPRDAYRLAQEREMDLVEVSPQTKPPVCRLMDYGRWKYEAAKKTREAAKANPVKKKIQEIREVKLRPKIDEHDYQVKSKMVRRLISEGDKVKVTMMFRGREVVHAQIALKLLERVFTDCQDSAIIENRPKLEGRNMIMVLAPKAPTAPGGTGNAAPPPNQGHQSQPAPSQVTAGP